MTTADSPVVEDVEMTAPGEEKVRFKLQPSYGFRMVST
jgi:hypothetical protein